MLRKVASKVAWVGRTASMVFGLALVLALLFGVASMAFARDGQSFILGENNFATALTKLTSNTNGSAMQVVNNNAGTNDAALSLNVQPGEAPMRVNSSKTVRNLSADKLDGKNATSFLEARGDLNGNDVNFNGIVEHSEGSSFLNTGFHTVVAHAPEGPPVDVLLSCPSQTSNGTLRIVNKTSEFGDSQRVWVDNGSADPSFDTLGQNQSIDKSVQPNGDHFTIQVASVFGTNRMATMELFTEGFGPSVCVANAHVIYTFAT